ncbi:MAG: DUF2784 domain-containing protein [Acidiferrobacteraceae bacterium]
MKPIIANIVLIVHVAFIVFVVAVPPLVWWGAPRGWRWVRSRGLRNVHLWAIFYVVVESWLGVACPLTVWEADLRGSGAPGAAVGFIPYWLHRLFFYRLPGWVFEVLYTLFAFAVVFTYWRYPPHDDCV